MSKTKITVTTRYKADLSGPDGGPTGIRLWRERTHYVQDGSGRRRWQQEGELNRSEQREELAEMSMAEAVELLTSLADAIGWMAKDHPECKQEKETTDG